ncbi:lamin-B1-like [Epinephelus fuscoguttatus]|uniref:lamin-B1-like n=1 Tax=Epinephelus fuscoguttatus TaxID=293821 RepID=UPI0020D03685|nr:lamin-B1-like [Epinephelus fuscoguttatus]
MMLFHADKRALKSHLRPLSVLVFHLLLTHSCRGQSQLIGSSQPIVATLGDDIILPCRLEPAEDVTGLTLEWTRPDLNPRFVYVWRSQQELVDKKHKSFEGRTSLFVDELKFGNISLRLSKVKLSDHGTYRCFIPEGERQTFVQLVVGAVSSPVISLAGVDKASSGVVLQCESAGWYPEPEVLWLDGEGKLLSAGPTETVRGPDDLYTVSSRVTVEKRHSNSFTCRVQQRNINQTTETHVSLSDDFFKAQYSFSIITGLAVSLAFWIVMFIVLLLLFLWKWRQDIIKTKRSQFQSGEDEKKKTDKPVDQFVNEEEIKPLKEEVEKKSKPMHNNTGGRDKHRGAGPAAPVRGRQAERRKEKPGVDSHKVSQQQLQAEQQKRKEAEGTIQTLKEKLETQKLEYESKEAEVQRQLQSLKEELETKNREPSTQLGENKVAQSVSLLPWTIIHRQTLENEQQRREQAEKQIQDLKQILDKKNKELHEEQRRREEAEKRVKTLEEELKIKEDEVQKHRVLLAGQQNTTHTGKGNLKKQLKKRVQKQQGKEEPETEVQTPKGNKNAKTKDKQAEVQQLQDENQTTENNQQTLNQKDHNLTRPASQDSAEKDITVDEVNVDGKYVRLSNNSEKDQPMGDWELHIRVNKRKPIKYQFYPSFILKAGNAVTIWASDCGVSCETSTDLVWFGQKSWGTGEELLVTIYSNTGELEVRRMLALLNSQGNPQQQQTHLVSQDSAMGNITVSDIDLKGSYVRLSNTSTKDQPFKGWELHIEVNDRKPIVYKFFSSFILEAGNTVTIWSSDDPGRNNPPTDLVWFSQKSWGTGEELLFIIYSNTGEEMVRMLKTPNTAAV